MNGLPKKPSGAFQAALEYLQSQPVAAPSEQRQPLFTIAISRQRGSRGSQVAEEVGRRLGWHVYDRQLVDEITSDSAIQHELAEAVDEKHQSWVLQCVEAFFGAPTLSEPAYVHRLVKVLLSLAAHGEGIIVGRGAGFRLPPQTTLRVGLVAPLKDRVKYLANHDKLSESEVTRKIQRIDQDRRLFVKDHFHKDPRDMDQYDLVLNTSRYSNEQCAELIIRALEEAQSAFEAPEGRGAS